MLTFRDIFRALGRLVGYEKPYLLPVTGTAEVTFWTCDPFFTAHKAKTERLAQIVQQRNALKEMLALAIRQKKSRRWIYEALEALKVEELRLESGK